MKIHTFMHNTRIFQTTHMNRIFWYSIRKLELHYALSNQILMLTWKKIRDPEECKGPKYKGLLVLASFRWLYGFMSLAKHCRTTEIGKPGSS